MKVALEKYNSKWPSLFEEEKGFLLGIVGEWLSGTIEHVGSTAVPEIMAKPIIDIMFGVESLEESKAAIEVLSVNGYFYSPYKPEVMHWFCKPSPDFRTHHIHLVPYGSVLWKERITFRDILLEKNCIAKKYSDLKLTLAMNNPDDREAYTQKKWPFIQGVLDGSISC